MKGLQLDEVVRLRAPAKVNLILRVLNRREDGYHNLETWMQKLDLYDNLTLCLTARPGIALRCDQPGVPADETNLAWKAAATFLKGARLESSVGVDLNLEKNIPAGAGLGGGSSDAGAVLCGLNSLCEEPFSEQELVDLARPLGADVPYFATKDRAVFATGIGDLMQSVRPLVGYTFILLNPGFSVSTKWVYETFALTTKREDSILAGFQIDTADPLPLSDMCNDLELITSNRYPEIQRMKSLLIEAGASHAMMSGSGPTVFGVFPDDVSDKIDIPGIAERLGREYKNRVFVTRACAGA